MDVAAFVGFASAGPVGVPVAVDDEVRFRELFGPDLPLAWDRKRGEMTYAHLAPAVREFFRNGGRRCWIVRAADEDALEAASFRIPGMLHGRGRLLEAAWLLASSPGSWADGMSLNATLLATFIAPDGVRAENAGLRLDVEAADLLRLRWSDGTVAFFPPHPGAPARDLTEDERKAAKVRQFAHAWWFRPAAWADLESAPRAVHFLAGPRELPLEPVKWEVVGGKDEPPALEITLAADAVPDLQPGAWIRALLDPHASPPHGHSGHATGHDRGGVHGYADRSTPPLTGQGDTGDDGTPVGPSSSGGGEVTDWPGFILGGDSDFPVEGPSLPIDGYAGLVVEPGDGPGVNPGGSAGLVAEHGGGGGQGSDNGDHGGDDGHSGGNGGGDGDHGNGGGQGGGDGHGNGGGDGGHGGGDDGHGGGGGDGHGGGDGGHGGGNGGGGDDGHGGGGDGGHGGGDDGHGNSGDGGHGGGDGGHGGGNGGGDNGHGGGDGHGGGPELLGKRAYLLVEEVRREADHTSVTVREAWRTLHHAKGWKEMEGRPFEAAFVEVELWTRHADGSVARLPDVGLVPQSPRFLGGFPSDDVLFAPTEELTRSTTGPDGNQLSARRLPLAAATSNAYLAPGDGALVASLADAGHGGGDGSHGGGNGNGGQGGNGGHGGGNGGEQGPDDGRDDDEGDGSGGFEAYLPLGVPSMLRDDFYQAAYTSGRSALERDGLGAFTADLFLDDELARQRAETLLDTAFYNAYVAEPPLPPRRMHALLNVEEVSLLAVPDAVHTGWREREAELPAPAPAAPTLLSIGEPDAEGEVEVRWTAVPDAVAYALELSPDPRFRRGVRATPTTVERDEPGTKATVIPPDPCPGRLYYRVRARTEAGLSAWSRTELVEPPEHAFVVCVGAPLAAPVLTSVAASGDRLVIRWAPAAEGAGAAAAHAGYERFYRVESSSEPSFSLPDLVHEGKATEGEVWKPASGTLWFRAASWLQEPRDPGDACPPCIVEESPWSTARPWGTLPPRRWETLLPGAPESPPADEVTRAVHLAMLRFCAARSDCFAVLALPRHHREAGALAHVAALAEALGGSSGEAGDPTARTLSFGALYHPWTVVRVPVGATPLRAIPPDGATTGVMASRANELGAWAAPANQPLAGVAILDPLLPESVRATFLGNRVNAVARFPRGFMTWSEETLSDDPELRGVGVRRLLILLRRLAVREGNTYVFEPNSVDFRRLVQRQFDELLGDLYVRGAFAGKSHAEGYLVVTDETVNPPQGVDQGRLIVELRVAPSRPMAFLTVRLVQTGAGIAVRES